MLIQSNYTRSSEAPDHPEHEPAALKLTLEGTPQEIETFVNFLTGCLARVDAGIVSRNTVQTLCLDHLLPGAKAAIKDRQHHDLATV